MSKTKKFNIVLALLSFILVLSCVLFGFSVAHATQGEFNLNGDISDTYYLEEQFIVPKATLTKNDVKYDLEHVLTYPDGRQSSNVGNQLNVLGQYKLTYFSTQENVQFSKEYKFNVIIGDVTSLFVTETEGCTIEKQISPDRSWCDFDFTGVAITLPTSGGSFAYKYPIDLSSSDPTKSFIEFIPDIRGTGIGTHWDTKAFIMRLTDVNDPDNYIEIHAKSDIGPGSGSESFISTTYANKYPYTALLNGKEAEWKRVALGFSFDGKVHEKAFTNKASFSYVADEKQLFGQAKPQDKGPTIIWDYDNPEFVDPSVLFSGFSENRAYLSFVIESEKRDPPRYVFTSINGNDLSGSRVESEDLSIFVDTLGYDINDLPYGIVGQTYPVFNAKAYDNIGIDYKNVSAKVIAPNGVALPILNGKVKTETEGKYQIIYTAVSPYYQTSKVVEFNVLDNVPELSYQISDEIVSSVEIDGCVKIYDGNVLGNDNDKFGKTTVKLNVYNKYGKVEIENYGLGNFFMATTNGEYDIVYTVEDMLGRSKEVVKTVSVYNPKAPKLETPVIPRVMIVNRSYNLPIVKGLQYINGGVVYLPVKVFVDGVEVTDTMVFKPTTVGEYIIKYQTTGILDGSVVEYTQKVSVQDPLNPRIIDDSDPENVKKGLFLAEYLSLENASASFSGEKKYNDEKFRITAVDPSKQTASVEFSQKVPEKALFVEFMVEGGKIVDEQQVVAPKNQFEQIKITFKDSLVFEQRVEILLSATKDASGNDAVSIVVNGVDCGVIEGSFYGTSQKNIKVAYDYTYNTLVDVSGKVITKLVSNYKGQAFNGFSSKNVYVELEFLGITGDAEIKNLSIGNLTFGRLEKDILPPVFIFNNDQTQAKYLPIGTVFAVEKIFTYDTLGSPITNILRIKAPDESVVYNGNIDKSFDLLLDKPGVYTFQYVAKDEFMQNTKSLTITVYEEVKPVITPVEIISEVRVGEAFNVPEIKATDNFDTELTTYIYILDQYGRQRFISSGEQKLDVAGRYIVRYVAIDDSNNLAYLDYAIVAK